MSSIVNAAADMTGVSSVPGLGGAMGNIGGLMQGITNPANGVNWQAQGVNYGQNAAQVAQQQAVLNQAEQNLQGIASGQSNPMLAKATGENIKGQAGAVASTKGINPALAATLASQNATQQNMNSANQAGIQAIQANQALIGASTGQQQVAGGINASGNQAQAGLAGANAQGQMNIIGNLSGAAGKAAALAHGGMAMPRYAMGDIIQPQASMAPMQTIDINGPKSMIGQYMMSGAKPMMATGGLMDTNQRYFDRGGKVPARVSPGELYLNPRQVEQFKHTGHLDAQRIPGHAKVKGDSLKNDVVDKTLDAGGIVVPRTKAGDAAKAARFVSAVLAKNGRSLAGKKKAK